MVCCVSFFSQKISTLSRKQTNRKFKNCHKTKLALGVQQKIGLLEQQTSLNCNGVLFGARKFFLKP